jgi:NAD(P)-dependent dehydrogenase (short-subunit alcohol dehydrogenase family)
MKGLEGKVALVTGGGTGIGRAGAMRLAEEGAQVVIAGRRAAELEATAQVIAGRGGRAFPVVADVSKPEEVERLVAATLKLCGGLDLAWNNAGALGPFAPVAELNIADFDAVFAVNLRGLLLCLKEELRVMMARGGGAIVNTSSWTTVAAMPGTTAYAASKAALDAVVRTVALEAGSHKIRINNIAPGVIVTPMSQAAIGEPSAMAPLGEHAALRRVGEPEDVADAAVWLLSEEARFVTGQSLLVDGGFSIGGPRL